MASRTQPKKSESAPLTRQNREERIAGLLAESKRLEGLHEAGDESVTYFMRSNATGELNHKRELLATDKAATAAALRAMPNLDTTLADLLANTVAKALEVPVSVSTDPSPSGPSIIPSAVITQPRVTTFSIDGYVSGKVQVHYFRISRHREADAASITAAAQTAHMVVESLPAGTREQGEHLVDLVNVDVRVAWESLPKLRRRDDDLWRFNSVGTVLALNVGTRSRRRLPTATHSPVCAWGAASPEQSVTSRRPP